jgi:hypothetical protein
MTARGLSYTAGRVQGDRLYWGIPCHQPATDPQEAGLVTVAQAAATLGLRPPRCTAGSATDSSPANRPPPEHRGASASTTTSEPWFVDHAPEGWLATLEATLAHGVSRQTLLQRVKRGELRAVHVRTGRRKRLRIEPPTTQRTILIMTISGKSIVSMHPKSCGYRTPQRRHGP